MVTPESSTEICPPIRCGGRDVGTIDMKSTERDSRPILDEVTEEAQRALRDRPALSIRARLTLGLTLWVILSVGIAIWSMLLVSMIETKLHFLESSQNYSFEIQQARRFEKNYLLYRSNLDEAIEHVDRARAILRREEADMSSVMGRAEYGGVRRHLKRYEELLVQIERLEAIGEADAIHIEGIEAELRNEGGDMVKVANQLVAKEREQVDSMLRMSKRIPVLFVALLLTVIIALTYFIAKQMMAPLGRMMRRARGIAGGDLTPIVARRKYRDEFSELGSRTERHDAEAGTSPRAAGSVAQAEGPRHTHGGCGSRTQQSSQQHHADECDPPG